MICPNCGTTNSAGARFCLECGTPVSQACRNCAAPLASGAKFCSNCGTPTADGAARTMVEPAGVATPVTENKLVSVLFADLVGFTSLAEGRDAEDTRDLLTRYFDLAGEIMGRYGGTVEKFIGDAVMAVWGAPTAHEDDAERAVRAGLDLVDAVPTLGSGLAARAAVLTGDAAVTLGATNQGLVAGDLVNTASRLQSVAPPGAVLVGEGTRRAASAAIVFEAVDAQSFKGKSAPVAAYRAVRVSAERGGRGRVDRLEAALVGRDDELRLLKELFHATARERRPRIVSITGQAGVGKSRITLELSRYIDGIVETVYWQAGRSPAYGEGITFWALGEMVRARAGLAEGDDEATTRAKIADAVEQWVPDEPERRWVERALLALLGVEPAQGTREELFAAWRTFFERIAALGPTVMLFEDLEWADSGLLDFIDHVLDWSRNVPLFIVTLARPDIVERRPSWGAGRKNFVALGLEPLPEPKMRELLSGLVPGLPDRAARSITARADGIPLYAMETVRMLVAEGKIVEAAGTYRPSTDLSEIAVPETLQALIAARLDSLEPVERSLVQDAAVLGQSFTPAGLAAVSVMDAEAIEEHLRGLVRRELMVVESDPRSPERGQYGFVQALIREVAYGTLAKPERRSRHLAAARYLESLGDDELAGALAAHYLAAYRASAPGPEAQALAAQARVSLKAAASRAAALGSPEQAAVYFVQAIDVTDDPAEAADLLEQAGTAERVAGRHDRSESHLRAAIERRREVGDREGIANAIGLLGQAMIGRRTAQAIELLEPAASEFADLGDRPALAMLEHQLARATWLNGDDRGGAELAGRALARAERLGDIALIADTMITKGGAIGAQRINESLALMRGGQQLAEANGLTSISLRGLLNLGATAFGVDPRQAQTVGRQTITLARRLGLRLTLGTGGANVIEGAVQLGDWEWAVAEIDRLLGDDLEEVDQMLLTRGIAELKTSRGEPIDDLLAKYDQYISTTDDPSDRSNYEGALAARDAATGDYRAAAKHLVRSAELTTVNRAIDLPRATRMALWGRDLALASRLRGMYEELHVHGPGPTAWRPTLDGGIAALEGRREQAVALFTEAAGRWAEAGIEFEGALIGPTILITLGPDEPGLGTIVAETRAALERLGAKPYVALMDRLQEMSAPAPQSSAAQPRHEVEAAIE